MELLKVMFPIKKKEPHSGISKWGSHALFCCFNYFYDKLNLLFTLLFIQMNIRFLGFYLLHLYNVSSK